MDIESEEVVTTETETETEETTEATVETTPKKVETPEAKRARLQRQLAQLDKRLGVKEESQSEVKPENSLIEKGYLGSRGIVDKQEVKLALETAKKWGMSIDDLVDDDDFQQKLEKHRTRVANEIATTGIKGDTSGSGIKDTPAYWTAKGVPPTREQVPDRKARVKIARAFMDSTKSGKTFYND